MNTIILTGGHLSPAVAAAEEFKNRGWRVIVLGRTYAFMEALDKPSLEKNMMEEIGVEFHAVHIQRFPRSIKEYILYIPSLLKNVFVLRTLLRNSNPSRTLTFGGYISVPVALASYTLGIPLFIHDQTVRAGRANRILSFLANSIFISWEETRKDFPSFIRNKVLLTGNPIRKKLRVLGRHTHSRDNMQVYITGGSTGSHFINTIVGEGLEKLLEHFTIVHQCGDSHYNDFEALKIKAERIPPHIRKKYTLCKYVTLTEMPKIMEKSHIIIGRSGANTVIEIALHAKVAIFIPLPYSQYNEQEILAKKLELSGSAVVLKQSQLTVDKLVTTLLEIKKHYYDYIKNAEKLRQSPEIALHARAHHVIADSVEHWGNAHRA